MYISQQLTQVLSDIKKVIEKANRNPAEVQLIAVSKTYPVEAIIAAYKAGQRHFGENRPQELKEKHDFLLQDASFSEIKWHLIGQLQRNKVKYIAPFVHLIHSIDSQELMEEVQKQAAKYQRIIEVLLQINISQETQKSGLEEAEAETLLAESEKYPNVKIVGLMGMASFTEDKVLIKTQFHRLAALKVKFQTQFPLIELTQLSMGMSGDYEIAITEGATLLRIGTAIFGKRPTTI